MLSHSTWPGRAIAALVLALVVAIGSPAASGTAQAGESENTLPLTNGGQFVFWSHGPAQADEVFDSVMIAWLFNPTAVDWTSYIPQLGVTDFPLADGDVLWVVSEGPQTIAIDGGPLAASACADSPGITITELGEGETIVNVFFFHEPPEITNDGPLVCSVERSVPVGAAMGAAVSALLAGPTQGELDDGIGSRWTDVVMEEDSNCDDGNFVIGEGEGDDAGLISVQFCRTVILTGVISDALMDAQLTATMMQFPGVNRVIILNQLGDCMFNPSGLNLCLNGDEQLKQ
jgi:hypothetical protein